MAILILPKRYERIKPLRTQSMDLLFTAFDTFDKLEVVVKAMNADPSHPDEYKKRKVMFEHEIYLERTLQHHHILSARADGETMLVYPNRRKPIETLYIVYEFMQDGSLLNLIDDSPPWQEWTLYQIGDIIRQAASALHYIHKRYTPSYLISSAARTSFATRPLIHRDVKPDNFLARLEDKPQRKAHIYLSDFGIARTQRFTGDETKEPFGTFGYMAPEHFEGKTVPQSDQYSLAIMACYLLTGKLPLELSPDVHQRNAQDKAEIWYYMHLKELPLPPSRLRPGLLPEVDDIILKALSKKVEQRYPTIWEFANTLFYALTNTSRQTFFTASTEPAPRSPLPLLQQGKAHQIPEPAPDLYKNIEDIPTEIVSTPQSVHPSPAGFDWQSLPTITTPPQIEQALPASPEILCWSNDGNYLACLFADETPMVVDRQGHRKQSLPTAMGQAACWSPHSYELAISVRSSMEEEQSHILLLENANSATSSNTWPFSLATFPVPAIYGLDWSTRGKLAIWVSEEQRIYIYTVHPPFQKPISPEYTLNVPNLSCGGSGTLRWSPDGKLLAVGGRNGAIYCWQTETFTSVWSQPATQKQIFCLAWSADSLLLVAAYNDRRVTAWNIHEHRVVMEWKQLPIVPRILSISQHRWLAVASNQTNLYLGNIDEDYERPAIKYPGHRLVAWSPRRPEFATLHPKNDSRLILYHV